MGFLTPTVDPICSPSFVDPTVRRSHLCARSLQGRLRRRNQRLLFTTHFGRIPSVRRKNTINYESRIAMRPLTCVPIPVTDRIDVSRSLIRRYRDR